MSNILDYNQINACGAASAVSYNPDATISERIDQKILALEERISALREVKKQLAIPGGILSCRPDDLRMALD